MSAQVLLVPRIVAAWVLIPKFVMVPDPWTNQAAVIDQLIERVQLTGHPALAERLRLCCTCQIRCPGISRCPVKRVTTPKELRHITQVYVAPRTARESTTAEIPGAQI